MKAFVVRLIFIAMLFGAASAFAQQKDTLLFPATADSLVQQATQEHSLSGYYYRALFATVVIIGLIILGAKWYRRFSGQKYVPARQSIKILARRNVGAKQSIMIVAVEGRKLALGVTDQSITTLAELGPLSEEEATKEEVPAAPSFSQLLKKMKNK